MTHIFCKPFRVIPHKDFSIFSSSSQKSIRKDILLLSFSRSSSTSVQSTLSLGYVCLFVCLFVFQFEKLKPRIFWRLQMHKHFTADHSILISFHRTRSTWSKLILSEFMMRHEHFASGLCRAFGNFLCLNVYSVRTNFCDSLFKQQGTKLVEETLISHIVRRYFGLEWM